MAASNAATAFEPGRGHALPTTVNMMGQTSAVSWGAILAGAAAAAALSMILLILGTGLGLSSVSPWALDGVSATTFGVSTIIWLTLTQLIASGMGGYLAGRLRTKWVEVHADEAYFRDTAHGFLTWAVASLATAALLTTVIGSIIGGGVKAGASVVGSVTSVPRQALLQPGPQQPTAVQWVTLLIRCFAETRTHRQPNLPEAASHQEALLSKATPHPHPKWHASS